MDVLDIGCNTGHLTLLVARDLKPRKIVGVDIDEHLISLAQRNIRYERKYCKKLLTIVLLDTIVRQNEIFLKVLRNYMGHFEPLL